MNTFDFWSQSAFGMNLFQAFANNHDWFATLVAFSEQVGIALNHCDNKKDHVCADFGSGFCHSLRDVIGLLHFNHASYLTTWHAYEPDVKVADLIREKTIGSEIASAGLPGLATITSNIEEFFSSRRKSFSVITFMHSIYYFENAPEIITRCFDELLLPNGAVVILQMSQDSPFYLTEDVIPRNGTYLISSIFEHTSVVDRQMRFRVPEKIIDHTVFQDALASLIMRNSPMLLNKRRFQKRLREVFGGGQVVDLRDQIVVVRRP